MAAFIPLVPESTKKKPLGSGFQKNKCPRGDSNSYTFRRYPLKIVCLPISPLGLVYVLK